MDDLAGDPGWAGPSVLLLRLGLDDGPRVAARAALADDGAVIIDDDRLRQEWEAKGIVGRSEMGRVYPRDGQAFLDELPFMYRGAHLRAVPEDDVFGAMS